LVDGGKFKMGKLSLDPSQVAVQEFHKKFGLTINEKPIHVTPKDALLRCNLIFEELREFITASGMKFIVWPMGTVSIESSDIPTQDLVEVADAIADLLYVVYGAAITYGINAKAVFDEVHRSNMTKVWEDGTVHRREEDGKILKPPTYSKADIKGVLEYLGK
jgi:predicted HAD superfamily Cof-like phosphohydrolase